MKKLAQLALLLSLAAAPCSAQLITGQAESISGQPIPFAKIFVCSGWSDILVKNPLQLCTNILPPATGSIFSNTGLTSPLTLPFFADANGRYVAFASAANYTITITSPGYITYSLPIAIATTGLSVTGSPAAGNLAKFSGPASITNGDLSGDVTTSGTTATTLAATLVACGANQFATQSGRTPGCLQPSAANLTNGTTGSGAVVLATSPTIMTLVLNGATTGTGVQGTDSKLITSGTISGVTGSVLCTDAVGGATTNSCTATSNTNVNLAFVSRNLAANVSISANSTAVIDSVTLAALPAACGTNLCRLRISYAYYFAGGVQGWCWATNGTVNTRAASDMSNNNGNQLWCGDNSLMPATFSSGATPTISIEVNNTGSQTACATTGAGSPCNTGDTNVVLNSNMQIEVVLSN